MQKISEVMTHDVTTVSPEENIQRAAQLMDELHVAALPVCENLKLVGMITDRDITVRVTSAAESPENTKVREVMNEQFVWCTQDESIDEVMRKVGDSRVRRVPVVNAQTRQMIGIASLDEITTISAGEAKEEHSPHMHKTLAGLSRTSQPAGQTSNP